MISRELRRLTIATGLCLAMTSVFSIAHAQERHGDRGFRGPERMRLDARHEHRHYYPSVGYSVRMVPSNSVTLTVGGGQMFYNQGVWYRSARRGYLVVQPPLGVVVPVLPPNYTVVRYGNVPYYYANETYYMAAPGGYAVAQPPQTTYIEAPQSDLPVAGVSPATVPQSNVATSRTNGMWYYCESSKGYYPYVNECPEPWREVPPQTTK